MKFVSHIDLSSSSDPSGEQPLLRIERHLKKQNLKPERKENFVRATLFSWAEILSANDADRLSWRSLHIEHQDSKLRFQLHYNWTLQLIGHIFLSVFVCTFVVRFGSKESVLPLLASMNAALAVLSLGFAIWYARNFAREIERVAR